MPIAAAEALEYLIPISIVVMVLMAVVVSSATARSIHAYPSGGGSYQVSRENIGSKSSLVAGASLLFDYMLTVRGVDLGGHGRHHVGLPRARGTSGCPLCLALHRSC